jgi:hypothetical protein
MRTISREPFCSDANISEMRKFLPEPFASEFAVEFRPGMVAFNLRQPTVVEPGVGVREEFIGKEEE